MKIHLVALTISLIVSTGCLGAGYILAGYWQILPAFLVMGLIWMLSRKRPVYWPESFLLVSVILAAIGVIANLSLELMVIACTAALASWDLTQFNQDVAETSPGAVDPMFEKYHLNSLALASAAGLILAFISSSISLHLPLAVILLLVLITMGFLLYSTQTLVKKKP